MSLITITVDKIDMELLNEQRLNLRKYQETISSEAWNDLEGILNMLDEISDEYHNKPKDVPIDWVCEECGSSELSLEGFIEWSITSQEFQVVDLCDKGHYCASCDGECRIEEKEINQ